MAESERSFDFAGSTPEAAARAAACLKTLAHEGRLRILCGLLEGDLTVGGLAAALGMPQTTVSQQLMRLRAEGFVTARRQGKSVTYSLSRPEVRPVIKALREAFCAQTGPGGPGTAVPP